MPSCLLKELRRRDPELPPPVFSMGIFVGCAGERAGSSESLLEDGRDR